VALAQAPATRQARMAGRRGTHMGTYRPGWHVLERDVSQARTRDRRPTASQA